MKRLQMKYNLVQMLYWVATCSLTGYIAVFLQWKGLSNTEIGIVTGMGCILSVVVGPFVSGLIGQIEHLTINKLLTIIIIYQMLIFLLITFLKLPAVIIMILDISIITLSYACVPLLSMICMNHLKVGHYINFGLARGLGSIAYATTAFSLGLLVDKLNPSLLVLFFVVGMVLLLVDLYTIEEIAINSDSKTDTHISVFKFIKTYRFYFVILLGFGITFGASAMLSTYLINIVKSLGGTTSFYGIAVFAMAASELPFMAITHTLLKYFKSEQLFVVAGIMYLVRNLLICLAPNLPILILGMLSQGASYGLFTATITYYVSDHIDRKHEMMGQTMISMMSTGLGSFMGNVMGGLLQDCFGLSIMLIAGLIMTLIGSLILVVFSLKQLKTHAS